MAYVFRAFIIFLLVSCQPSDQHPYEGLVGNSTYLIVQLNQPDRFMQQLYNLFRYFDKNFEVFDKNWKVAARVFVPELGFQIESIIDALDLSQPILIAFSDETLMFGQRVQIIFSVKSALPATLPALLQEMEFSYQQVQNAVVITNYKNSAEQQTPMKLGEIGFAKEPSLQLYVKQNAVFFSGEEAPNLEGLNSVMSTLQLEPELQLNSTWFVENGSNLSQQLGQSKVTGKSIWEILERMPNDDFVGYAAQLDYSKLSKEYFLEVLKVFGASEEILEISQEYNLQEFFPLGLSVSIWGRDPTKPFFEQDDSNLDFNLHLVKKSSIEGFIKFIAQLYFEFNKKFDSATPIKLEIPKAKNVIKHGIAFNVWEAPRTSPTEEEVFFVETKQGDYFLSSISNLPLEKTLPVFKNLPTSSTYPFPKETNVVLWFNPEPFVRSAPQIKLDDGPPAKTWLLISFQDSQIEMKLLVNKQTLKFLYQLGASTDVLSLESEEDTLGY